jgi:hypothetical protein
MFNVCDARYTTRSLCSSKYSSRFQSKNNKELWQCLKRVFRYIKGTLDLKLLYKRSTYTNVVVGYADADWGSDLSDRKSTTGYLFRVFESCTICWNNKKQNSVATSSTEAEYMAFYESVKEAMWLKSLVKTIDFEIKDPIVADFMLIRNSRLARSVCRLSTRKNGGE